MGPASVGGGGSCLVIYRSWRIAEGKRRKSRWTLRRMLVSSIGLRFMGAFSVCLGRRVLSMFEKGLFGKTVNRHRKFL